MVLTFWKIGVIMDVPLTEGFFCVAYFWDKVYTSQQLREVFTGYPESIRRCRYESQNYFSVLRMQTEKL